MSSIIYLHHIIILSSVYQLTITKKIDFTGFVQGKSTGNREKIPINEKGFLKKKTEVNGLVLITLDGVKGSTNYLSTLDYIDIIIDYPESQMTPFSHQNNDNPQLTRGQHMAK